MIELSITLVIVALLARNGFGAWLHQRNAEGISAGKIAQLQLDRDALMEETKRVEQRFETATKMLAEDLMKKVRAMEKSNEDLRKHIEGQVAGTIAQLPPSMNSGFNRRA